MKGLYGPDFPEQPYKTSGSRRVVRLYYCWALLSLFLFLFFVQRPLGFLWDKIKSYDDGTMVCLQIDNLDEPESITDPTVKRCTHSIDARAYFWVTLRSFSNSRLIRTVRFLVLTVLFAYLLITYRMFACRL